MFSKVIIPSNNNKKVLEFCRQISDSVPFYIDVIPEVTSTSKYCHHNVKIYTEKNAGEIVYGWIIWQQTHMMLEAEFHSVWKSPCGRYLDITPNRIGSKQILFVPDMEHSYDFYGNTRLCNKWHPLTNHPDFKKLNEVLQKHHELLESYPGLGKMELTVEDSKECYRLEQEKVIYMQNIIAYEKRIRRRR